jgi:hypothetical protein
MKILMLLLIIVAYFPLAEAAQSAQWECVRWSWTGDVYNRKVVCLEWRKKEERNNKK